MKSFEYDGCFLRVTIACTLEESLRLLPGVQAVIAMCRGARLEDSKASDEIFGHPGDAADEPIPYVPTNAPEALQPDPLNRVVSNTDTAALTRPSTALDAHAQSICYGDASEVGTSADTVFPPESDESEEPNGPPPIPDEIAKAKSLGAIVEYLYKAGVTDGGEIAQICIGMQPHVPVLSRIKDLPGRVERALAAIVSVL